MLTFVARLVGAVALFVQMIALAGMALLLRGAASPSPGSPAEVAGANPWAMALAIALGVGCVAAAWSRTGALIAALLTTIAIGVGLAGVLSTSVSPALAAFGAVSIGAWVVQEVAASVRPGGAAELHGRSRRIVAGVAFFVALTGFVGMALLLTAPSSTAA